MICFEYLQSTLFAITAQLIAYIENQYLNYLLCRRKKDHRANFVEEIWSLKFDVALVVSYIYSVY